jgi:hypothetical protein
MGAIGGMRECCYDVPCRGAGRIWRPPAPRVEHARPFSDEFWRFGPDNCTSIDSGQAARPPRQSGRGRFCGARHTPALHSHTCARARDTQVWRRLRRERQTRASRQEQLGSQGRAMQANKYGDKAT